jgi:murein DD-endopeptidase MepM/ murein hydrolase activator NlpD
MKSGLRRSSDIIPILLMAWWASIVVASSWSAAASAAEEPNPLAAAAISLSAANVANGQVTVLEINLRDLDPAASDLKARLGQNAIALFQHPVKPPGIYCGLIGIPLGAAPEKAVVELEWTDSGGRQTTRVPLQIIEGNYKSEAFSVDPGHVTLSKKDLQRVAKEKKEIQHIYANSRGTRLWYGSFKKPLAAETTSAFGTRRLFNGQHRSHHRGTDFRADVGTAVQASNSGIVRLAKNLFYSGNIVIVDHGLGIFTNYAHLSKIQVIEGQHIARGDPIGLAGATGRVSGPHLHWGVKVNGVYVDPLQFLTVISSLLAQ